VTESPAIRSYGGLPALQAGQPQGIAPTSHHTTTIRAIFHGQFPCPKVLQTKMSDTSPRQAKPVSLFFQKQLLNSMNVKIINHSNNPLPAYKTVGSAGMDLHAHLETSVTLAPLERQLIPTGLHIELPQNYEAQIRPRSGLAAKHGISVVNSPGTIDSDYRGEIKVCLVNLSNDAFEVKPGERIAQMVVAQYTQVTLELVEELSDTVRGSGGFGHTGK